MVKDRGSRRKSSIYRKRRNARKSNGSSFQADIELMNEDSSLASSESAIEDDESSVSSRSPSVKRG